MKILQINNYNFLKGGSERVYQVTIELLKSHGHDVRYFSVANQENIELCEGFAVETANWKERKGFIGRLKGMQDFIYNSKVAKELDAYLQEFHPDVAHLHIFYGGLSNAVIDVLKKHHIPMVQSVHEYRLLCPAYTCLDSNLDICEECAAKSLAFSCIQKKCVKGSLAISGIAAFECFVRDHFYSYQKNIDAFIMVSRFINDLHIKYYPQISSKCYQIYNSVDINSYEKYVVPAENKEKYYLYLGRLSYEKGIKTLIDVFAQNPSLKLKIAGTGPIEDDLKKSVFQLGLTNVEFLGFLSGEKLLQTIASAYFTVVPSEWYENNPLSIIESLALGTPVIGSNIGGIPELIKDGYNGYLHHPKQIISILEIINKTATLESGIYSCLCTKAKQMAVELFDNEVYYQKLMSVYTRVV